ncbi:MAG: ATP-binding protein, partial [Bacteroidales bacterium]
IGNFLNNAVKFTSVGVIRLGYSVDRETLEIFVEDSGIGIPQAELESIFNPYVRLNADFQGTGLGLAICKSIVEMMQGTIGATSQLGAGSRFWCKIPYQPIEQ